MQYHLIDLANIQTKSLDVVEQTFQLWKDVYSKELESRQLKLHEDDFWSARLLAVIENGPEIVGAHLYNVFDLRSSVVTSHRYFHDISSARIEEFKRSGTDKIMSMEYLLVNPTYRGQKSQVRWAEVVIGLGFRVALHSPWDAIVGIARADKKVNAMGAKMGCSETDDLIKNQTPCKVMFMPVQNMKSHPDQETQSWIDRLWSSQLNFSPWFEEKTQIYKQAA